MNKNVNERILKRIEESPSSQSVKEFLRWAFREEFGRQGSRWIFKDEYDHKITSLLKR